MVIWTSDTVGIARPDADSYGVGSYLDEARVPAKPEPTATPPTVPEIIPRIEMAIEGGGHLELWDAKPECVQASLYDTCVLTARLLLFLRGVFLG